MKMKQNFRCFSVSYISIDLFEAFTAKPHIMLEDEIYIIVTDIITRWRAISLIDKSIKILGTFQRNINCNSSPRYT